MKTEARLLKITGILMLVFGGLGLLVYTVGLAAVIGVTYVTKGVFSGSSDLLGMWLLLAAAVTELVAGILGVRATKLPERAGKGLLIWGLLTLLLTLAGTVHIILRSDSSWWRSALGLLSGLVVPIVYLAAASKLRSSSKSEPDQN